MAFQSQIFFYKIKKIDPIIINECFLSETGRSRRLVGGATVTLEQVPDQLGLLHPNLPEVTQNKNFFSLFPF